MPNISYPYDATGVSVFNYIVREPHVLSEINSDSKRTIIPVFSPFYQNNFVVEHQGTNGNFTPLVLGVDYDYGLRYIGGTVALGKSLFGGIIVHREYLSGMIYLTYQTLGGTWVADRNLVLETLASEIYNPRMATWDQITNIQETFPPSPHTQPIDSFRGMEDLIAAMDRVKDVLAVPNVPSLFYQQETLRLLTEFETMKQKFIVLNQRIDLLLDSTDFGPAIQALQTVNATQATDIQTLKNRVTVVEGNVINITQNVFNIDARVDVLETQVAQLSLGSGFRVTLEGPTAVKVGETIECKITDFETYGIYTIITNKVNVTRNGKLLTVTGMLEGTDAWFDVNGSKFPLTVTSDITYQVTGPTAANEGSSVTFTVTTGAPNGTVLYWSTNGSAGLTAADFTDNALTGGVTVNNGTASIVRSIANDGVTDSPETFSLSVHTGSPTGTTVATGPELTVSDLGAVPVYTYLGPNTVQEGAAIDCNFSVTSLPTGTLFYWTTNAVLAGAADFTNTADGTVTLGSDGQVHILRTLVADQLQESGETFQIQLRTGSITGTVVATSTTITITESALVPVYGITGPTSGMEGDTLTFTMTATNTPNGTDLYYSITPLSGILGIDFDFINGGGTLEGMVTITNGTGTFTLGLVNDLYVENNETFQILIHTGSPTGPTVATSEIITVSDLVRVYGVSYTDGSTGSAGTAVEGDTLVYRVETTNVASGTILYWSLSYNNSSAADFSVVNGTMTVVNPPGSTSNNHPGAIVFTLSTDSLVETAESFIVQLRTGSITGPVVASTPTMLIKDPEPIYSVVASTTTVREGRRIHFTVTGINVPASVNLAYTINGTNITSDDFSTVVDAQNGISTNTLLAQAFELVNGSATIYKDIADDAVGDEPEVFYMQIRTDSVNGPVVATSFFVTITTNYPDTGTLLSTYCVSENTKGIYADGSGGTYEAYREYYSLSCGYARPADGIAVSTGGMVAVAATLGPKESNQNRVYLFAADGTFLRTLERTSTPVIDRGRIVKILFHPINNDLYMFTENGAISRYSMSNNSTLPLWTVTIRNLTTDYFQNGTGTEGRIINAHVQPSGKIVLGVHESVFTDSGHYDFMLLRISENTGALDTTFGPTGNVYLGPLGDSLKLCNIAIQADGKILAVSTRNDHSSVSSPVVSIIRVLENGSDLDTSFGFSGRFNPTYFPSGSSFAADFSIAVTIDGNIVVIGKRFAIYDNLFISNNGTLLEWPYGTLSNNFIDLVKGNEGFVLSGNFFATRSDSQVSIFNGNNSNTTDIPLEYDSIRSLSQFMGGKTCFIHGGLVYVCLFATLGTEMAQAFSLTTGNLVKTFMITN